MAYDITEEFQLDVTSQATAAAQDPSGSTTAYDVAIGTEGFFDYSTPNTPYRRQTAPYQKDQNDNSNNPGEQTLLGWWLRSQSSFHYGAGLNFFEPSQEQGYVQNQTIQFRYSDSQGVNVWTPGQVTLLKDVVAGHNVVGSAPTYLRPIRYSNTDAVLMLDNSDVDKILGDGSVVHFVNYTTGTSTAVYAICDDGVNAYWVTNRYTGGKCQIYNKPLTGDDTTAEVSMYYDNSVPVSTAVIEYVKGRLIAAINNKVYELDPTNTGGTNLGTPLFTSKSTTQTFTAITESPSDIYLSAYDGIYSNIYRLTVSDSGSITTLTGASVAAEMPRGEIIYTIKYYLGYMLIGTSRGVRVAQVDGNGGLTYGPLIFESSQPVYQFAVSDHYAWCTAKIGGDAGTVRIDLAVQIDNLVFPYANDVQAVGSAKECTGVGFLGQSNRLTFTSAAGYIYVESATVLRSSGYLMTGKIRFNTTENKYFRYINPRAEFNGGSIGISTATASIVTVDATNGNTDIGITETDGVEFRQFKFTINRSATNSAQGPSLYSYQVKALPAYKRQRLIQYSLLCYDKEQDRNNNVLGYIGRAYQRIQDLEDLEAQSNIVTVRDYRTGETFSGIIEEVSFIGKTAPVKNVSGYGGILTVTVRKIS